MNLFGLRGLLADKGDMGLTRIPPDLRGPLMLIIALIIFIGLTLIGFAWWWGRVTRRYMNSSSKPVQNHPVPTDDDWATKPIVSPENDDL